MPNGLMTVKWRAFHESLARILELTVVVLDTEGNILDVYHAPGCVFSEFGRYPALSRAYRTFFRTLSGAGQDGSVAIVNDPLDLPVAVVALENGLCLVLIGGLPHKDAQARLELEARLEAYGIPQADRLWLPAPALTVDEFREKAERVQTLYAQLLRFTRPNTSPGPKTTLPTMVVELNKLVAAFLGSEGFKLRRILDLVTSSLVVLFDAEGAWAFTYYRNVQTVTAHRGRCTELLVALERHWREALVLGKDAATAVAQWAHVLDKTSGGLRLQTSFLTHNGYGASLGIVNPETSPARVRAALSAFGQQVTMALKVAAVYHCAQQRLGSLLNSVRHGLIITNGEGRVVIANQAARRILAAYGFSLTLGQPITEHKGLLPIRMALCAGAAGETYCRRQLTLGQGEATLHLNWDVTPLYCEDGTVAGAVLTFEDVTENVHIRRRLQEWEKLATAGEVAASLAHEIRNPLAAAAGAIQLFDLVDDEHKRQEILTKLRVELNRMNKILTNFLRFAKPGTKESLQSVDLVQVIEDLRFLLRSEANLHDVELVIHDAPDDFPQVTGDPDSLKQVFINIAKNAVEAVSGSGRLEISLHRDAEQAWVTFRDNGPGISRENINNVTRPFFTTKLGGTGLGLWISSTIVQRMGGKLRLESEPGRGTTVQVVLPLRQSTEQGSLETTAPGTSVAGGVKEGVIEK
jgi:signal transduction histidine kinase